MTHSIFKRALLLFLLIELFPGTCSLDASEVSQFQARSHTEGNTGLQGTVSLTEEGNNYRIQSNGIPDHSTGSFPGSGNPNTIRSQSLSYSFPKSPTIADSPTCLPPGPIAVSVNGVPIFNPNNIDGENAVEGSTAEVFDACQGHPNMFGSYHYHQKPGCVYGNGHDELVGVALDGFPIYGPKDSTGKTLSSADLDNCHGHTENGQYRYRMTSDYPYVMACFKGTPSTDINDRQLNSPQCQIIGTDSGSDKTSASVKIPLFIATVSALMKSILC